MTPIEEEFRPFGVVQGNALLLPAAEAIRLVARCSDCGVNVFGIEGFVVTADATRPQLDHILDCSGASAEASWAAAEEFLRQRLESSMMFEVTC
jgi:hypothetical protein